MIIQCEQCKTKFRVDDSRIKPTGSKVRCSKCGNVFSITREEQYNNGFSAQPEKESATPVADGEKDFNWESIKEEKKEPSFELENLSQPVEKPVEEQQTTDQEKEIPVETPSNVEFSAQPEKESATPVADGEKGFNWENIYIQKEEKKEPSFELENFSQPVEKSVVEEQQTTDQEKEIPIETPLPQKELRIDLGKKPEEFTNVSEEKGEVNLKPPYPVKTEEEVEKKEEHPGFNWENLSVDKEPIESLVESPKLFDETAEGVKADTPLKDLRPNQESEEPVVPVKPSDKLVVDKEKLLITKKGNSEIRSSYPLTKVKSRAQTPGGNALEKIVLALLIFFILAIMIGAGVAIAINLDLVPKDQVSRIGTFVLSKLPTSLTQHSRDDVVLSDYSGKWVSTRNGLIYVVSGRATNRSKYIVNYIRIKSEFMSDGERLFEQIVYAGNTFTDSELKTLPFEDVLMRLNRKNGNINFDNPKKLAGLNYAVQPGESVPFFAVFPSKGRILGLKYNIGVEDFEKTSLE